MAALGATRFTSNNRRTEPRMSVPLSIRRDLNFAPEPRRAASRSILIAAARGLLSITPSVPGTTAV
jgi:hypothetical protein